MADEQQKTIETADQARAAGFDVHPGTMPPNTLAPQLFAGGPAGAPQPQGLDPRVQEQIVQLLQRAGQPRMQGPTPSPEVMKAAEPMPTPQKLTGTLFGLIMEHAQRAKSLQLAHASQR